MLVASLLLITAFVVGFAMKRSALCTYVAAQQIVHHGNFDNLLNFLAAAAWGTLFIVPLSWLYPETIKLSMTHSHQLHAIVGGSVLGLGAYLNRGCVFGTFVQLVGGNLTYLGTLLGISLGVVSTKLLLIRFIPVMSQASPLTEGGMLAALWLLAVGGFGILVLLMGTRRSDSRIAKQIFILLVIGVGGGLLFAAVSGWDYVSLLSRASHLLLVMDPSDSSALAVLCGLAMLVGGISGAVSGGSYQLNWGGVRRFLACAVGGSLMGASAVMVPGGNDGMVLIGIPSLASHSMLSYLLMVSILIGMVYLLQRNDGVR